jgi:hypothetical protein
VSGEHSKRWDTRYCLTLTPPRSSEPRPLQSHLVELSRRSCQRKSLRTLRFNVNLTIPFRYISVSASHAIRRARDNSDVRYSDALVFLAFSPHGNPGNLSSSRASESGPAECNTYLGVTLRVASIRGYARGRPYRSVSANPQSFRCITAEQSSGIGHDRKGAISAANGY